MKHLQVLLTVLLSLCCLVVYAQDTHISKNPELKAYMAEVKRKIGPIWKQRAQNQMDLIPVGEIHIRVTFHSDGTVDAYSSDTDDIASQNALLTSISINSIKIAAPFAPFPETLRKQIGDTYIDTFTFQIYGTK